MLKITSLLLILNNLNYKFRENRILRNYIIVNPIKNENENLEDSGIELEYIKNERENKRLISKSIPLLVFLIMSSGTSRNPKNTKFHTFKFRTDSRALK